MKLIRCYIENFGKFHKYSHDFENGLNVIKEDNGFGKTTFATFIKAMFYGLEAKRTEKTDRKMYSPWQGGAFGGNIEFEINDKRYRIERFFGSKSADDTFKLIDLSTNLECSDFSENIGEEIFKINKDAYERSTYIPQGKILTQMEDSISAKLGNVLESENDVNTSEEAINRLKESMKFYQKTGGRGAINEKKDKLSELKRKLENGSFDERLLKELQTKLENTNQEIKEKTETRDRKQKMLTKKIEREREIAKLETYNNLVQILNKSESEYKALQEFFKNGKPTDEELDEISQKYTETQKLKIEIDNSNLLEAEIAQLNKLENKFLGREISEEEIDLKIADSAKIQEIDGEIQKIENEKKIKEEKIRLSNEELKKSKRLWNYILILGIIATLVGVFMLKFAVIGIGIALAIISVIMKMSKRNPMGSAEKELEEIEKKLKELEKNKNNINSEISGFIAGFGADVNLAYQEKILFLSNIKIEYMQYKELLNKKIGKEKGKEASKLKEKQLEDEIQMFMFKYFADVNRPFLQLFQELKNNMDRISIVKDEYNQNLKNKQEFDNENKILTSVQEKNENLEDIDEKALNTEIQELSYNVDKLLDAKNQLKNQIEILENKIDEMEFLQNDIENLQEEIRKDEDKYKILSKTKDFLEKAKENFSSNYLKDMIDGFRKYLKLIDDTELETNVDINLNVQVDVEGSKREIKNFSKGYQDLMHICVRFGLINALFKEEEPFVVLDDPFVNLDDSKTKKAMKLLEGLANDYQIVYFVCNSSRV